MTKSIIEIITARNNSIPDVVADTASEVCALILTLGKAADCPAFDKDEAAMMREAIDKLFPIFERTIQDAKNANKGDEPTIN